MADDQRIATIGFVGLGNMGTPMAGRLIDAGYRVLAFDLSESARARVVNAGGVDAPNLAAVARSADAIILMLPDSRVVSSVLTDAGLAETLAVGTIVVDMSSSEPLRTRELAAELKTRGVHMIDAPVSGGVAGAIAGKLTIMIGGSDDDVEQMRPVFEKLGRPLHAGPVGSGHAVKALNNLLSATHLWATSEAIEAGRRFGLDPEVMLAIFNLSSGRSGSTENKWPNFVIPETYNSGFGLRLMLKDMRIAVQLAEQSGASNELGVSVVELWAHAATELPPQADHTEIARWLRERPAHASG